METKQENVIRTDYSEIMQKSYIDYAMSVIISRALPDVRDGLKPVALAAQTASILLIFMCSVPFILTL